MSQSQSFSQSSSCWILILKVNGLKLTIDELLYWYFPRIQPRLLEFQKHFFLEKLTRADCFLFLFIFQETKVNDCIILLFFVTSFQLRGADFFLFPSDDIRLYPCSDRLSYSRVTNLHCMTSLQLRKDRDFSIEQLPR